MTDATKKQALAKLHAIANKIGYPDKWRDYTRAARSRAATRSATRSAANAFECARQLAKIGKPVDKTEWQMTPPTVNAYYNPLAEQHQLPGRHPAAAVLRAPRWTTR